MNRLQAGRSSLQTALDNSEARIYGELLSLPQVSEEMIEAANAARADLDKACGPIKKPKVTKEA